MLQDDITRGFAFILRACSRGNGDGADRDICREREKAKAWPICSTASGKGAQTGFAMDSRWFMSEAEETK